TLPADTHLVPWFSGDPLTRIEMTQRNLEREFPGIENPRNPLFGEMDDQQGDVEYRRLVEVYESIRDNGFRPARGRHDAIQGVFLRRRDGERRFLVMAGKHRVAALAALTSGPLIAPIGGSGSRAGVHALPSRIPVWLRRPGVVRELDVDRWGLVQDGFWPRDAAIAFFNRLFEGRSCFDVAASR
ncbi:MAG: hypothetical protein PF508_00390, partial [Spirochaeta sp.]|nr:hypothetical protein [Spirochaeta sp.]